MNINIEKNIGYKAFKTGLIAYSGYVYEVGKIFEQTGKLKLCENGLHFCWKPLDVDNYYFPDTSTEYAIVKILGDVVNDGNKSATNKMKILQLISRKQLLEISINTSNDPYTELYGDQKWYHNNILHRTDGPAIIKANGDQHWYYNGVHHRCNDEPALITKNGDQYWYIHGKYHRTNGPAIVRINGDQHWYHKGARHRDNNQPAIIRSNGDQEWYYNGKRHRENNMPAIIKGNGVTEWFINGQRCNQ